MKELSSFYATIFFKFIFPAIWIIALAVTVLLSFTDPGSYGGKFALIAAEVFLICCCLFTFRMAARLKLVSLDGDVLHVAGNYKVIQVPLSEVAFVSEGVVFQKTIVLTLKSATEFGREIVFTPEIDILGRYRTHPLTIELERMIGREEER